jgi:hypothetical protein
VPCTSVQLIGLIGSCCGPEVCQHSLQIGHLCSRASADAGRGCRNSGGDALCSDSVTNCNDEGSVPDAIEAIAIDVIGCRNLITNGSFHGTACSSFRIADHPGVDRISQHKPVSRYGWLVVLCAPRWVEDGAAPVTWRPLVGRSRRIGEACKSRRLK